MIVAVYQLFVVLRKLSTAIKVGTNSRKLLHCSVEIDVRLMGET